MFVLLCVTKRVFSFVVLSFVPRFWLVNGEWKVVDRGWCCCVKRFAEVRVRASVRRIGWGEQVGARLRVCDWKGVVYVFKGDVAVVGVVWR